MVKRVLVALTAALGMLPMHVGADTIEDGATVRIRSNSIESGWHTGRIMRDSRHCSMVQPSASRAQPSWRDTHRSAWLSVCASSCISLGWVGLGTASAARV